MQDTRQLRQVSSVGLLVQEKKRKIEFQDGSHSDRNDFSYFLSISRPDASYQVLSQLAQGCRRSRLLKQNCWSRMTDNVCGTMGIDYHNSST